MDKHIAAHKHSYWKHLKHDVKPLLTARLRLIRQSVPLTVLINPPFKDDAHVDLSLQQICRSRSAIASVQLVAARHGQYGVG
jgi:hypothetical protein